MYLRKRICGIAVDLYAVENKYMLWRRIYGVKGEYMPLEAIVCH